MSATLGGQRIATLGWDQTGDSILVHVTSLPDTHPIRWATFFGEGAETQRLADGTLMVFVRETQESMTVYHVREPGGIQRVGTIPRRAVSVSASGDGGRVVVVTQDSREDVLRARIDRVRH